MLGCPSPKVAQIDVAPAVFVAVGRQRQHIAFEALNRGKVTGGGDEGLGEGLGFFHRLLEQVGKAGQLVHYGIGPTQVQVALGAVLHGPAIR